MTSAPYIDGDTLAEAREALRNGQSVESLAGKLSCSPEHLAGLLGLPQLREIPADDDVDLFAPAERLDAML